MVTVQLSFVTGGCASRIFLKDPVPWAHPKNDKWEH
jgi:hypothetical protein